MFFEILSRINPLSPLERLLRLKVRSLILIEVSLQESNNEQEAVCSVRKCEALSNLKLHGKALNSKRLKISRSMTITINSSRLAWSVRKCELLSYLKYHYWSLNVKILIIKCQKLLQKKANGLLCYD